MSVDKVEDKQVVRIYSSAMAEAERRGFSGIQQIAEGFRILQKVRQQPGMSTDLSLAAAEWFAFARVSVATGSVGKAQMKALSYGYWIKKVYDKQFGDPNAEAVTSNPVSEPNKDVADWGVAGASQGEADHAANAVATTPPFWRSVDSIMGESKGGYRAMGRAN